MSITATTPAYAEEMAAWHDDRLEKLKASDGYLSLVGLTWLKSGVNRLGSAPDNDCVFPSGLPEYIGTIEVNEDRFWFESAQGADVSHDGSAVSAMQLLADSNPAGPTLIEIGSVNWFVIQRGDALGIRIRDTESATLQNFSDVDRFPLDQNWRIQATFVPHDEPHTVPIPTILGTPADMVSPGVVRLTVNDTVSELIALKSAQPDQLFLIIADDTTSKESYGGGRFLMTESLQEDGSVVVDFNKATNPPCAFTLYATCPRPPAQNRLSVAIRAGEKTFQYE